jgi:phasin family protein
MPDDPATKMQNTMTEAATGAAQMGKTTMDAGMAKMAEFTKMFSDMKVPGMAAMPDMDAFLSAHRRNMEVLTAANRVALEGAQAVARRHMEIMQQTMSEMTETMRDLSSPDSPQTKAAKQTELMKSSYERAVAHMKELADLIQRANGEALGMLNHRFAEAMDEVKLLAAKTGSTSAS